jgi:hypothetical protein
MITINNILNKNEILSIKNTIDNEIETALCKEVPLYQSYNNMNIKYKNNNDIINLFDRMLKETEIATNEKLNIAESWFNICKKDSKFQFHNHKNKYITCVYFLENCAGNGTIFKINNSLLQLICQDNSLAIFDAQIFHTIPKWDGKNRYTVAMDFVKKEV